MMNEKKIHENYYGKHGGQNTLNKQDKLNWNKEAKLRYIKMRDKNNGDVYYSELTPGKEKPLDNDNFTFEYVGRDEALINMYASKYGKKEMLRMLDQYLYNVKYKLKDEAMNNFELEVIRNQKGVEDKLLNKGINLKLK